MDCFNTLSSCVSAIATVAMAFIAWIQLSRMNKTINDSSLMSNFEIEFELNKRKEKLAEIRIENEKYIAAHMNKEDSEEVKSAVQIMKDRYDEYLENYLNIFDRLCYYIRQGKLDDNDFRTEYREMLNDTVKEFDEYFKTGTRYQNMVELDKIWRGK